MLSMAAPSRPSSSSSPSRHRRQLSGYLVFAITILLVNLCPLEQDSQEHDSSQAAAAATSKAGLPTGHLESTNSGGLLQWQQQLGFVCDHWLNFAKLMFTNPMRLGKRTTRFSQAHAAMLGKMAKVWYIKKKIKKLGKRLKKHTIAVPVFTAIPIYEHSYYPHPQVTHVAHGGGHHAAAAAAAASIAAGSYAPSPSGQSTGQQLATAASNTHQQALRVPFQQHQTLYSHANPHSHHQQPHHHHMGADHRQIINAYAPSPPLYVDEAGGLYGHYGNAYGRYDGGYQLW